MTVYVNWARVGVTPFDLTLDLGFRTDNAPPSEFPVRAIMTLEHAKELGELLGDAIKDYEENVGEIRNFGMESVEVEQEPESEQEDTP